VLIVSFLARAVLAPVWAISAAVAGAVRDAVRSLLGPADESADYRDGPYRDWEEPAYPDWDRPDRPLWREDQDDPHDRRPAPVPRRVPRSRAGWKVLP